MVTEATRRRDARLVGMGRQIMTRVDVFGRTNVRRWVTGWLAHGLIGSMALAAALLAPAPAAAWEPSKTVEFIVPAGTGGGADQMARFLQGIIAKHSLMKQPLVVINKPGGGQNLAFTYVSQRPGDGHTLCVFGGALLTNQIRGSSRLTHSDFTPIVRARSALEAPSDSLARKRTRKSAGVS